jgi:beta-carotene hydroxylase
MLDFRSLPAGAERVVERALRPWLNHPAMFSAAGLPGVRERVAMGQESADAVLKVDRAWIGAPSGRAIENPTVWLALGTVALLALGTWGHLAGVFGWWTTVPINALGIYLGFTVLHEAMHGIAHPNRRVNALLGRLGGIPLTISFPLFRAVHYEHHSHTNDPQRDPDLIVAHTPRLLLPLWCLAIFVEYRAKFYGRRLWRDRAQVTEALAWEAIMVLITVVAITGGWFVPLLVVWFAPAALAIVFLGICFDFLPHYPYDTDRRYFDTRIYPGRALNVVLLGQNYHLVHHLWTTIPWFRYQRVFAEIRADLVRRGCRIGWQVTPLPDAARARR